MLGQSDIEVLATTQALVLTSTALLVSVLNIALPGRQIWWRMMLAGAVGPMLAMIYGSWLLHSWTDPGETWISISSQVAIWVYACWLAALCCGSLVVIGAYLLTLLLNQAQKLD